MADTTEIPTLNLEDQIMTVKRIAVKVFQRVYVVAIEKHEDTCFSVVGRHDNICFGVAYSRSAFSPIRTSDPNKLANSLMDKGPGFMMNRDTLWTFKGRTLQEVTTANVHVLGENAITLENTLQPKATFDEQKFLEKAFLAFDCNEDRFEALYVRRSPGAVPSWYDQEFLRSVFGAKPPTKSHSPAPSAPKSKGPQGDNNSGEKEDVASVNDVQFAALTNPRGNNPTPAPPGTKARSLRSSEVIGSQQNIAANPAPDATSSSSSKSIRTAIKKAQSESQDVLHQPTSTVASSSLSSTQATRSDSKTSSKKRSKSREVLHQPTSTAAPTDPSSSQPTRSRSKTPSKPQSGIHQQGKSSKARK